MKEDDPLYRKCVSCTSFVRDFTKGVGICVGNAQAYKEVTGRNFTRGAPEGPSFSVRKLDSCSHWVAAW